MAEIKNTKKAIKQSNKIIKGIDRISEKSEKAFNKLKNSAIDETIKINGKKSPFSASSLVSKEVDDNLRQVIDNVNNDFNSFIKETQRYLIFNYSIKLTKKDLNVISKKASTITDALVNNTDILKTDIQNILTQNLAKGVSEKQLVQDLKELYPAYASNAKTLINTGTGRLFIDINVSKFRDTNFEWYIWAGPDDSITRETPCKHWVWHRFPAKQLDILNQVRSNLWNCRHSIIPIPNEEIDEYPIGDISKRK